MTIAIVKKSYKKTTVHFEFILKMWHFSKKYLNFCQVFSRKKIAKLQQHLT